MICSVDGCGERARSKGMCDCHYQRTRNGIPLEKPKKLRKWGKITFLQSLLDGHRDECIRWPFVIDKGASYPRAHFRGVQMNASRVMCIIAHGDPSSPELEAAHFCGNSDCVNPKHLRWASRSENSMDKHRHGTMLVGDQNRAAKLFNHQAMEIRNRLRRGELGKSLAVEFGISPTAVSRIRLGRTWSMIQ